MKPDRGLIRDVRKALREAAEPAKAPWMQAYMKSEMPYLGVSAAPLRKSVKAVFAEHPIDSPEEWRDTALALWREAKHREERYAAIELTGYLRYRTFGAMDALPMYEEMIVTGAWWDFVDALASQRIGALLRQFPREMTAILRKWARSDDMWKRRSAILAQLTFKRETDLRLLAACILPSIDESEFFLRKAIGWALRQYARTDPVYVGRFVRQYEKRLSPLSKREAMKHITGKKPARDR